MSDLTGITHHTAVLNGIRQHWVSAGQGPPVYLLHGFPQTWYGWRKQIPVLAERFTVIAPDLRGYGDTDKPASGYDKRTMANDVVALMDHLGHERIALVGHDRGARVGTRFAKDHPERIDRFVAMDNIPTRVIAETYDVALARQGYWFFTFLGVPDLPEALIAGREETWLTHFYRSWSYDPETLTSDEIAVYVRAYQQPGAVRGSCMDYRAAPQDVAQDQEDADRLIDCPVLTLWGEDFSAVGQAYDVLDVWRGMARDVRGVPIAQCGHLCQEERPDVVNRELLDFLTDWNG
ncbi:alpha/beta fold hydrolase [Streptomyces sp. NPDC093586]|uniref:alpha/beta fold hydrolase n=1 Tax=Streptomyces sp. NPDC093586 TaxID=3366042 RepID=UPI0038272338